MRAATLWLMFGLFVVTSGLSAAAQEKRAQRLRLTGKTGRSTMYEAAYTDKKGKKYEALVTAEGADAKP